MNIHRTFGILLRANHYGTTEMSELVHRGILVFTTCPESVGRTDKDGASFDPSDGRIFIYLDRMNSDDAALVMAHVQRECAHAAQFNDRGDRPEILRQIVAREPNNRVKTIVASAYGKNGIATRAIDRALAAARDNGCDANGANLETMPSYVFEATKARKGFGRMTGLMRDVKSAAREFIRSRLGVGLEFSLSDINSASQRVVGEIAKTTIKRLA